MRGARRFLVVALVALGLVAPTLSAAQADEPSSVPTRTRLFVDYVSETKPVTLTARISSAAGVPTGSVTFFQRGIAEPIAAPVVVDARGDATLVVPHVSNAFYAAEFTGTGVYADSVADGSSVGLEELVLTAEPTIARIGGPGLLKLNLTMSAHAHYTDGSPAVGNTILFTLLGVPAGPSVGGPPTPPETAFPLVVCQAKVDHDGLATCKGTGTIGALVSILTLGGYASYARVFSWDYVKLPVILTG